MLFNDLFRESCRTALVRGGGEPEYLPANETEQQHAFEQVEIKP